MTHEPLLRVNPIVKAKVFDSSQFSNYLSMHALLKIDSELMKFIRTNKIHVKEFGGPATYGGSDTPFMRAVFKAYLKSSNEEKVILEAFIHEALSHFKSKKSLLYIGAKDGIHPAGLAPYFGHVEVMDKFGDGLLSERLEYNIRNNPAYQIPFDGAILSHSHYFEPTDNWVHLHKLVNSIMNPNAVVFSVIHRGKGQTEKLVNQFNGSADDTLRLGQFPSVIAQSLGNANAEITYVPTKVTVAGTDIHSMIHKVNFLLMDTGASVEQELQTTVHFLPAQVTISGVKPSAMLQKVGFLFLDSGAMVSEDVLKAHIEMKLKDADGIYRISRYDEIYFYEVK